jgi:hypothetical protein
MKDLNKYTYTGLMGLAYGRQHEQDERGRTIANEKLTMLSPRKQNLSHDCRAFYAVGVVATPVFEADTLEGKIRARIQKFKRCFVSFPLIINAGS